MEEKCVSFKKYIKLPLLRAAGKAKSTALRVSDQLWVGRAAHRAPGAAFETLHQTWL